jgi:hypothetical protein
MIVDSAAHQQSGHDGPIRQAQVRQNSPVKVQPIERNSTLKAGEASVAEKRPERIGCQKTGPKC